MLSKKGFDLWANTYDQTVQISEENDQYPFAGYKAVLGTIFNEVMQREKQRVLDIGVGTGFLAAQLNERGHLLSGLDFSSEMIASSRVKMPDANLYEWDLQNGLPDEIVHQQFDAIISTYTLHHFIDARKVELIHQLGSLLSAEGTLFIGDIAFLTMADLDACRIRSEGYWDPDEYYFVNDEFTRLLGDSFECSFHPQSHCAGVFIIRKKTSKR